MAQVTTITTGGTAVTVCTGPLHLVTITNPLTAADQNIATAEPLYVDCTGAAATVGGAGTVLALQPGQSWVCPHPFVTMSMSISANAATSGHRFTAVTSG